MVTIEKKELPQKVADALEVLKDRYNSDLLSRGYDFVRFLAIRPQHRNIVVSQAASEVYNFIREEIEPMRYYSELLLAGYTIEKTQEEINKEALSNAKELVLERLARMEDFATNGPAHLRRKYERGEKPHSHVILEGLYEELEKIEL
jgi:hypothetical protein